jgi:hypothetical protein
MSRLRKKPGMNDQNYIVKISITKRNLQIQCNAHKNFNVILEEIEKSILKSPQKHKKHKLPKQS